MRPSRKDLQNECLCGRNMGKPCTNGTRRENCGKLGLMDKTRVWSSLPAWSRVNVTTAGSGMVVEDKTARTQVVKGETAQS
jgi:hypothetical protein